MRAHADATVIGEERVTSRGGRRAALWLLVPLVLLAQPLAAQIGAGPVRFTAQPGTYLYEGARLIIGDESAPIEDGALLVIDGYISEIGRRGEVELPPGGMRVDLSGKTVMPTMTNVHIHIGYEGYPTWGPENFTTENVVDHLQRLAFYGVGATLSVGSDPPEKAIEIIEQQGSGRLPIAAQFVTSAGVVAPGGGPDHILIRGTDALRAVYEVETEEGARHAVRDIADKRIQQIKVWVGDRGGAYPAMSDAVLRAVTDEAHKHNIKVHAHASGSGEDQRDQKTALRADVDVMVHPIRSPDVELLALVTEKRPYYVPDLSVYARSLICDDDSFALQSVPAEMVRQVREKVGRGHEWSRNACAPPDDSFGIEPNALRRVIDAGARVVLGTDEGVFNHQPIGWASHVELEAYVKLGMTPAEAIIAATSTPAEVLGIRDGGTLAALNRADFLVLDANPLDDIRNTREIDSVYIRGVKLDREALRARWNGASTMTSGR